MASFFKNRILLVIVTMLIGALAIAGSCDASSLHADSQEKEGEGFYTIQTGTYDYSPYAVEQLTFIRDSLNNQELAYVRVIEVRDLFTVRVGKFTDRAAANRYLHLLRALYPDAFILTVKSERVFRVLEASPTDPFPATKEFIEVVLQMTDSTFIPNHLNFDTDKLYKLKIVNIGTTKREFDSPQLSDKVFTRKIVIADKEGNLIAEIKGKPTVIEVAPGQTVEWWFVPKSIQNDIGGMI
ncbi:MAG: SPOR domain-containing protein [Zetaproteobacteria bacterium]|jgi:SPOR domain|nr:SPOR domain-containing protein [Zetaproteobacteria bacterium]